MRPVLQRLRRPLMLLVASNAVVFGVYTLPRLVQERSVVSRLDAERNDVARRRADVAARRARVETAAANARDVERFYGDVVGRRTALVPVLREVEAAAAELGVRLERRDYGEPEEVEGARLLRFRVRVPAAGRYAELAAFLDRLERTAHFLTVDKVTLRNRQGGEAALDVELSAYFLAEEEDRAA